MKILLFVGTRPEVLKLAPLYFSAQSNPNLQVEVFFTRQQEHLGKDSLLEWKVPHTQASDENYERLEGASLHRRLSILTDACVQKINQSKPDIVCVQGDTSTTLAGALAGMYSRVRVAHIEAGLRSYQVDSPYPEEFHRKLVSEIASLHFASTPKAAAALIRESVQGDVYCVGNTIVDMFRFRKALPKAQAIPLQISQFLERNDDKYRIFITAHRRENQGEVQKHLCEVIQTLSRERASKFAFLYIGHMNPLVRQVYLESLEENSSLMICEPLQYTAMIDVMETCDFGITDSGGIQEEAPMTDTRLFVIRDTTERPETVEAGYAVLVGKDMSRLEKMLLDLSSEEHKLPFSERKENPYGDGFSAEKIFRIIQGGT